MNTRENIEFSYFKCTQMILYAFGRLDICINHSNDTVRWHWHHSVARKWLKISNRVQSQSLFLIDLTKQFQCCCEKNYCKMCMFSVCSVLIYHIRSSPTRPWCFSYGTKMNMNINSLRTLCAVQRIKLIILPPIRDNWLSLNLCSS